MPKVSDGSFLEFPAIQWNAMRMRELLLTVVVSSGLGAPVSFDYSLDKTIGSLTFLPWDEQRPINWEESLWKTIPTGSLLFHQEKVIYERYLSELTERNVHVVMSLTKSFKGWSYRR